MSEQFPGTERAANSVERHEHITDEELINQSILEARKRATIVDNEGARMIASQLHGGQHSAIYALASSGAITENLLAELWQASTDEAAEPMARLWAEKLEMYVMVRIQNGKIDAVEGWSHLWGGDEAGIATSAWTEDEDWPEDQRPGGVS